MVIGHRSAIRHTHTMCCPICKSISGVRRRRHAVRSGDSIEYNKQHAVGIEQISKKKSSLCARLFNRNKHYNEWSMDEADSSTREREKRREMNGQKGFTFN